MPVMKDNLSILKLFNGLILGVNIDRLKMDVHHIASHIDNFNYYNHIKIIALLLSGYTKPHVLLSFSALVESGLTIEAINSKIEAHLKEIAERELRYYQKSQEFYIDPNEEYSLMYRVFTERAGL